MVRRIIYLINPISGTRKKAQVKEMIIRKTREAGIDFDILPSMANGQYENLKEIIRQNTITDVVVCGGDGMRECRGQRVAGRTGSVWNHPHGIREWFGLAAKIPRQTPLALELIFTGNSSP
jgi:diacylglycerol kinase family enzyme